MTLEKALSEICVKCGMCCDGTLFGKASLTNESDELVAIGHGLNTFREEDHHLYFKLPCRHFKGCCTIYDQKRPDVCGSFFCKPLRKVKKGSLSIQIAQQQIEQTLTLRTEILALAQEISDFKNHSIADLMEEIRPKPSTLLQKHPSLWLKMIAFQVACAKIYDK